MSEDAPWALSHLVENGNVRNVKRLYELLEDSPFRIEDREEKVHFPEFALANWLATRGVLVPRALTHSDSESLYHASGDNLTSTIEVLERIAKGESE